MIRSRVFTTMMAGLLALAATSGAGAEAVTDQLRHQIERVLRTLEDPALKGPARAAERRQALRDTAGDVFDWREMARRSLGAHWASRSEVERAEFASLFRDLIERAYFTKVEQYSGEPIRYAGEAVDGDRAVVQTRLVTRQGNEVAVDYVLARTDGRWLIQDIVVESVSLTANYRAQFDGIIRTSSYRELVRKIRTRLS